jgi:hypothetical protein
MVKSWNVTTTHQKKRLLMSIDTRLKKLEQRQDSTGTFFEFVNDDGSTEVVMMYGTHEQWLDTLEYGF